MSTVGNHRIVHGLLTAMLALGYAAWSSTSQDS